MDDFSVSESSRGKRMKRLFACNQIFSLRSCSRDWAGLPRNVLFSIMDKLILIDDYVRFGAVCRNWRLTFVEEISKKPLSSHPPFLLIAPPPPPPSETVDRHPVALYSLSRKRVYDFRLQMLHNKVCRGSSFGWLVTLEKRTEALGDCLIQLQNPFLNRSIDLPSLDAILQQHPEPEDTRYKFDRLDRRSVVSWTPMVAGYVRCGDLEEAVKLFLKMQEEGVLPNEITMLSLILECGFAGALELGKQIHGYMLRKEFDMSLALSTAPVDMYGKCGETKRARTIFDCTSERDVMMWTAMISAK